MSDEVDRTDMYRDLVSWLAAATDSQANGEIRSQAQSLLQEKPSSQQLYDFLDQVSQKRCPEDISAFVRAACDVRRHYPRP